MLDRLLREAHAGKLDGFSLPLITSPSCRLALVDHPERGEFGILMRTHAWGELLAGKVNSISASLDV